MQGAIILRLIPANCRGGSDDGGGIVCFGFVSISIPDAPVKENMKDKMEMGRGVLNHMRKLFL